MMCQLLFARAVFAEGGLRVRLPVSLLELFSMRVPLIARSELKSACGSRVQVAPTALLLMVGFGTCLHPSVHHHHVGSGTSTISWGMP